MEHSRWRRKFCSTPIFRSELNFRSPRLQITRHRFFFAPGRCFFSSAPSQCLVSSTTRSKSETDSAPRPFAQDRVLTRGFQLPFQHTHLPLVGSASSTAAPTRRASRTLEPPCILFLFIGSRKRSTLLSDGHPSALALPSLREGLLGEDVHLPVGPRWAIPKKRARDLLWFALVVELKRLELSTF